MTTTFYVQPVIQQNHLISALPDEVKQRLLPNLELVKLSLDQVLYEPGDTPYYA
jgi:hypothetical protein